MNARQLRTLRGAGAAAVAAWTAAVSHTLGGGVPPAPALVLVVILLAAPVGVALAGRGLGIVRLALTVVATQLLLHTTFAVTAGLDPRAGAHIHGGSLELGDAMVVAPDPLMTTAHLLAALVTVVLVHRGERMLRGVARGLAHLVRPAPDVLAPLAALPPATPVARPAHVVSRTLTSDVSRRGPPLVVIAA